VTQIVIALAALACGQATSAPPGGETARNAGSEPVGRRKEYGQASVDISFSLWAEMAAHPQRLNVTLGGDGGLWALAGQDDGGQVALLIVNPTEIATSWQALFPGRDLSGGATLYQVSDASDEMQVLALETPAAEIGAYTVQLVIVNP